MHVLDSPAALRAALRELAGNLWFTWLPGARALFEELGRERFAAVDHNPTALLADLDDDELAAAATPAYVERVQRVLAELQAERERRTWWQRRQEDDAFARRVLLLRVRARREPADLLGRARGARRRPPEVRLGSRRAARRRRALLPEGYFRQQLDENDWQGERYPEIDPSGCRSSSSTQPFPSRSRTTTARSSRCARRSGARRSDACRSTSSTPTSTATRTGRARSPTGCTAATGATGYARSSCSASAASGRCARSASSRRSST